MKATLEFNLPEETEQYNLYMNGPGLASGCNDFDNYLRSKIKYEENTPEVQALLQEIRAEFSDLTSEFL